MISNKAKALDVATNLFLSEKCPFPGDEGTYSEKFLKEVRWYKRTFEEFLELAKGLENFLNDAIQNEEPPSTT
jgi:hypothetical protein